MPSSEVIVRDFLPPLDFPFYSPFRSLCSLSSFLFASYFINQVPFVRWILSLGIIMSQWSQKGLEIFKKLLDC